MDTVRRESEWIAGDAGVFAVFAAVAFGAAVCASLLGSKWTLPLWVPFVAAGGAASAAALCASRRQRASHAAFQAQAERSARSLAAQAAELGEARATFKSLVSQAPCGLLIVGARDGAVRHGNASALAVCGGDAGLMTGEGPAWQGVMPRVFLEDGSMCLRERLPLVRALAGERVQDEELILRDAEGTDRRVSVSAAPLRSVSGEIEAAAATLTEITQRRLEEERRQNAQRLSSVGVLAGGIAHDFNNILMALYGNVGLAREELPHGHAAVAPLEDAERSMHRATRLTRQLLTFAQGGEPVRERLRIGELVDEVLRVDLAGSAVACELARPEGLWQAFADKGQIQQVVSNLTVNAREAMPHGGRLRVKLGNAEIAEGSLPGVRPGKYVRIALQDEGGGIERRHLGRIFEPYFSTKEHGSGLGLATTYSIVSKHGGHIGVTSEVGAGTTFTLHLPAVEAPQEEAVEAAPELPAKRPRVLVLDDEEMVLTLVARMLRKNGFDVETAAEGRAAVEKYREAFVQGGRFDAAILDLTVPGGLGGKEAFAEILVMDPAAKGIVSSGYAVDPVMARHADYGFKGVVTKPYTQQELVEVLRRVVGA